jgi:multiple sugar transport system substrate-binding protein
MRGAFLLAVLAAVAIVVGACGSDESAGGPRTLNFYTFTAGTGGAFEKAVASCNRRAGGRYKIVIQELPPNADDQREQLARRLAAKDDSIDIMALDVIFTGEFAEAEWIVPFPQQLGEQVKRASIPSTYSTGVYQDRLYAAPYTSNTQLLWYRKDRVPSPPKTWDEMLEQSKRLGGDGRIEVQGKKAEGYVVWFNSLIESAGGSILASPTRVALEPEPTKRALGVIQALAASDTAADPSLPNQGEDDNRLAFETGKPSFMVNYPFIYPSAKENAPDVFEEIGAARYPGISADEPSKPPLGGINLAVGAFSKAPKEAFDAAMCLRRPENQLLATELGGLPPTQEDLYASDEVKKAYPEFAPLMLESIKAAAPRPATPAYSDVSLAVQTVLHPPDSVTAAKAGELRDTIRKALKSEGLL